MRSFESDSQPMSLSRPEANGIEIAGRKAGRGVAVLSAIALALAGTVAGCATPPEDPEALAAYEEINDPLEPMNRYFFEVNYALDEIVLKPIAGWYYVALPNPVQDSVRNFLRNLTSPVIFANDMFQGETDRGGTTLMRFLVNSTVGIAGLFDVASEMGFLYHDEDFGQTLAVHGAEEGPYLVIPLLGPSNPRDLTGRVVDVFLDPLTYITRAHDVENLLYVRSGVTAVDARARNLKTFDEIREGSLDYYATIRSLYRQQRNDAIRNGEAPDGTVLLDGATPVVAQVPETE